MQKNRRSFLKKVVYTAPVVIGLGSLLKPTVASAVGRPGQGDKNENSTLTTGN